MKDIKERAERIEDMMKEEVEPSPPRKTQKETIEEVKEQEDSKLNSDLEKDSEVVPEEK